MSMIKSAASAALVTALTVAAVEGGYRAYLFHEMPQRFRQSSPTIEGPIGFISPAPAIFSPRRGFDYLPSTDFISGRIRNGAVERCVRLRTNTNGGWSEDGADYRSADFRVLVVGDSFTAVAHEGKSWTSVLEQRLSDRMHRKAAVRNLARDGQGVIQMLDIAADELATADPKPDMLVIAYITDDLTRARIWRRNEVYEGKLRQFTTISGAAEFDPSQSVDTQVIAPEATREWCAPGRNDSIVRDIEQRKVLAVEHAAARANLFDIKRSFAVDVVRYGGDPFGFYSTIAKGSVSVLPRHQYVSYVDEKRTADNIAAIRASGIPVTPYHLSLRSEMRNGHEISANERELALLASLETSFGANSIQTLDNLPAGTDIERLGVTPADDHPSRYGMDIYAEALLSGLHRIGRLAVK